MAWLDFALTEVADQPGAESLDVFTQSIGPELIEQCLAATGTATLRRRRLPADQVLWLVLGMALLRDRPIDEVVEKLDLALPGPGGSGAVASSSVAEARQRLGSEPLKWLFERCSRQWSVESAERYRWRGLSVFAVDGSTLRVADSDENREHFGLAKGAADSGYPLARLAAVVAVRSHVLASVAVGPYATTEHELADQCLPVIPDDSVTIMDKGFMAARYLVGICRGGSNRHWLIRAKKNTKWKVLEENAAGDFIVELSVSHAAQTKDRSLPKKVRARAIAYQHRRSDGPQFLLTSLLDAQQYPSKELIALYHERWEIELAYDEIKTHLLEREETIRSRKVETVYQEIWGILLAFNLVRLDMERIAEHAKVAPVRISFVMATRYIRDEWSWCAVASPGSIPAKLRKMRQRASRFVLPRRRSNRSSPRAVKVKASQYPTKKRKRSASDSQWTKDPSSAAGIGS